METVTPDCSNDSFYVSAPTSPRRLSMETLCFYSVPTSPARKSFKAMYDAETEPTTPTSYEDASAGFIDFEFETSRRFNLDDYVIETDKNFQSPCQQQQQEEKCKDSLPAMAFADELFCDGKVMPLKPPPRFLYGNENNSALSSPRSPNAVLKFPFQRRSLWNDDFDPFMVALENVKQDNREKTHRRARSLSPLRTKTLQKPVNNSVSFDHQDLTQSGSSSCGQIEHNGSGPYSIWVPNQNGIVGRREPMKQEQKRPIRLAEPKGVLFARHARLVKMGCEKPKKPSMGKQPGATEAGEGSKESEGSGNRETKRKKLKKFLLKSGSMGRTRNEDKQKDESEPLPKRSFSGKFSFKSMGLAQYNKEKRVTEVTKMTIMQYRPKLLLCMGYGRRFVD